MNTKRKTIHDGFFRFEVVDTPRGTREVLHTTNSVSILAYDTDNDHIILVRQPRAALERKNNPEGVIIESIAGRIDKDAPVAEIAAQELEEEAGITVAPEAIQFLNNGSPVAVSAGAITGKTYLAYVEVSADHIEQTDRIYGSEHEQEYIERVRIPLHDLPNYEAEDLRVFALIQWFLREKT